MDVSILICTWNRSRDLDRCLSHVAELEIPRGTSWEVCVIDNNSTDDTPNTIEKWRTRLPIAAYFEKRQGVSYARNLALEVGKGDLLVYLDDDAIPCKGWLAASLREAKKRPDYTFFGGKVTLPFDAPPTPWRMPFVQNVSRVFATDVTAKEISESRVPLTVNLGIARRRLAGLRFDTDLGPKGKERICGEDMKFVYSLLARGDPGYWVPDAEIVHPFPFDRLKFAPILRQYLADGRCFARMTGGASDRIKWLPTPIAIAFRFCKTVVAMPKRGFWETFYSCVVIFGTLIEYRPGRKPMQYPSAPKNPGERAA